jgi:hypothetical protein|tara:strand:- start:9920 stop:10753 length:834 start_codon:yes stop_codon:yes gene_type:complete
MILNMEKFINFKQLDVVQTVTSTASGTASSKLISAGANFTQKVLVNAIVWDRTTGAANGGQKYVVTAVIDAELTLVPIGPTADQGTGVPDAVAVFIYMPEYTVRLYGAADGTAAYKLVDSSENFQYQNVSVGDYVYDITGDATAQITAIDSSTQLSVSSDIFVAGDNYLISSLQPDDFDNLIRSADIADVSNDATTSSEIEITYNPAGSNVGQIDYAYSNTVGANADMRGAIQDAVQASLETEWSENTYEFPGLLNAKSATNATYLGGKEYFFLRFQ